MADQDVKSSDRSVSAPVEDPRMKTGLEYPDVVRAYIKYLKKLLEKCEEHKIKHTNLPNCVIPPLLNLVLNSNWCRLTPKLINRLIVMLGKLSVFSESEEHWPVRDLVEVLKCPWKQPLLVGVLNGANLTIDEVFDLVSKEKLLVINRVKTLLENGLKRLCLNYLTWIFRCYNHDKERLKEAINLSNVHFLIDLYVILLNDCRTTRDVINVFKSFPYQEAIEMANRLRINRNRSDIATTVVKILIGKLSVSGFDENVFCQLIGSLCEIANVDELKNTLISFCRSTTKSDHIYLLARQVYRRFSTNPEMITPIIELYIRGLTTDANHLDKAKYLLKDPKLVREVGSKLSLVFQEVAGIFKEYEIRREFILNAFCVNPCAETLNLLEKIALERGTPISLSSLPDDCSWHKHQKVGSQLCGVCGGLFQPDVPIIQEQDQTKLFDPQKIALAPHLCDDLNVVLSTTRMQQLHWNLDWNEMLTRCRNYVEQYKDLKLMLSKELVYLNIDYSQFQNLPKSDPVDDPYPGVEKGYERFIENSDEDEDDSSRSSKSKPKQVEKPPNNNNNTQKPNGKKTKKLKDVVKRLDLIGLTGTNSNESLPKTVSVKIINQAATLPPKNTSTNPNTVKSLRAFRPMLKKQIPTDLRPMTPQIPNVKPPLLPGVTTPNPSTTTEKLTVNLPIINTYAAPTHASQKLNSANATVISSNTNNLSNSYVPEQFTTTSQIAIPSTSKQQIQQITPSQPLSQQSQIQQLVRQPAIQLPVAQTEVVRLPNHQPSQQTNHLPQSLLVKYPSDKRPQSVPPNKLLQGNACVVTSSQQQKPNVPIVVTTPSGSQYSHTNALPQQPSSIPPNNLDLKEYFEKYYWDFQNPPKKSRPKDGPKRKYTRRKVQNAKPEDVPTTIQNTTTTATILNLSNSATVPSRQPTIPPQCTYTTAPKQYPPASYHSPQVSHPLPLTQTPSTVTTEFHSISNSKHTSAKISTEQFQSIEDTLQKMFESDHSKSSSPVLTTTLSTPSSSIVNSKSLSVTNIIEQALNTPIAKTTNTLTLDDEFSNLFNSKGINTVPPVTTLSQIGLNTVPQVTTVSQIALNTVPPVTTVSQMRLNTVPQVTTVSQIGLNTVPQVTTVSQIALNTVPQVTTVSQIALNTVSQVTTVSQIALNTVPSVTTVSQMRLNTVPQVTAVSQMRLNAVPQVTTVNQMRLNTVPQVTTVSQIGLNTVQSVTTVSSQIVTAAAISTLNSNIYITPCRTTTAMVIEKPKPEACILNQALLSKNSSHTSHSKAENVLPPATVTSNSLRNENLKSFLKSRLLEKSNQLKKTTTTNPQPVVTTPILTSKISSKSLDNNLYSFGVGVSHEVKPSTTLLYSSLTTSEPEMKKKKIENYVAPAPIPERIQGNTNTSSLTVPENTEIIYSKPTVALPLEKTPFEIEFNNTFAEMLQDNPIDENQLRTPPSSPSKIFRLEEISPDRHNPFALHSSPMKTPQRHEIELFTSPISPIKTPQQENADGPQSEIDTSLTTRPETSYLKNYLTKPYKKTENNENSSQKFHNNPNINSKSYKKIDKNSSEQKFHLFRYLNDSPAFSTRSKNNTSEIDYKKTDEMASDINIEQNDLKNISVDIILDPEECRHYPEIDHRRFFCRFNLPLPPKFPFEGLETLDDQERTEVLDQLKELSFYIDHLDDEDNVEPKNNIPVHEHETKITPEKKDTRVEEKTEPDPTPEPKLLPSDKGHTSKIRDNKIDKNIQIKDVRVVLENIQIKPDHFGKFYRSDISQTKIDKKSKKKDIRPAQSRKIKPLKRKLPKKQNNLIDSSHSSLKKTPSHIHKIKAQVKKPVIHIKDARVVLENIQIKSDQLKNEKSKEDTSAKNVQLPKIVQKNEIKTTEIFQKVDKSVQTDDIMFETTIQVKNDKLEKSAPNENGAVSVPDETMQNNSEKFIVNKDCKLRSTENKTPEDQNDKLEKSPLSENGKFVETIENDPDKRAKMTQNNSGKTVLNEECKLKSTENNDRGKTFQDQNENSKSEVIEILDDSFEIIENESDFEQTKLDGNKNVKTGKTNVNENAQLESKSIENKDCGKAPQNQNDKLGKSSLSENGKLSETVENKNVKQAKVTQNNSGKAIASEDCKVKSTENNDHGKSPQDQNENSKSAKTGASFKDANNTSNVIEILDDSFEIIENESDFEQTKLNGNENVKTGKTVVNENAQLKSIENKDCAKTNQDQNVDSEKLIQYRNNTLMMVTFKNDHLKSAQPGQNKRHLESATTDQKNKDLKSAKTDRKNGNNKSQIIEIIEISDDESSHECDKTEKNPEKQLTSETKNLEKSSAGDTQTEDNLENVSSKKTQTINDVEKPPVGESKTERNLQAVGNSESLPSTAGKSEKERDFQKLSMNDVENLPRRFDLNSYINKYYQELQKKSSKGGSNPKYYLREKQNEKSEDVPTSTGALNLLASKQHQPHHASQVSNSLPLTQTSAVPTELQTENNHSEELPTAGENEIERTLQESSAENVEIDMNYKESDEILPENNHSEELPAVGESKIERNLQKSFAENVEIDTNYQESGEILSENNHSEELPTGGENETEKIILKSFTENVEVDTNYQESGEILPENNHSKELPTGGESETERKLQESSAENVEIDTNYQESGEILPDNNHSEELPTGGESETERKLQESSAENVELDTNYQESGKILSVNNHSEELPTGEESETGRKLQESSAENVEIDTNYQESGEILPDNNHSEELPTGGESETERKLQESSAENVEIDTNYQESGEILPENNHPEELPTGGESETERKLQESSAENVEIYTNYQESGEILSVNNHSEELPTGEESETERKLQESSAENVEIYTNYQESGEILSVNNHSEELPTGGESETERKLQEPSAENVEVDTNYQELSETLLESNHSEELSAVGESETGRNLQKSLAENVEIDTNYQESEEILPEYNHSEELSVFGEGETERNCQESFAENVEIDTNCQESGEINHSAELSAVGESEAERNSQGSSPESVEIDTNYHEPEEILTENNHSEELTAVGESETERNLQGSTPENIEIDTNHEELSSEQRETGSNLELSLRQEGIKNDLEKILVECNETQNPTESLLETENKPEELSDEENEKIAQGVEEVFEETGHLIKKITNLFDSSPLKMSNKNALLKSSLANILDSSDEESYTMDEIDEDDNIVQENLESEIITEMDNPIIDTLDPSEVEEPEINANGAEIEVVSDVQGNRELDDPEVEVNIDGSETDNVSNFQANVESESDRTSVEPIQAVLETHDTVREFEDNVNASEAGNTSDCQRSVKPKNSVNVPETSKSSISNTALNAQIHVKSEGDGTKVEILEAHELIPEIEGNTNTADEIGVEISIPEFEINMNETDQVSDFQIAVKSEDHINIPDTVKSPIPCTVPFHTNLESESGVHSTEIPSTVVDGRLNLESQRGEKSTEIPDAIAEVQEINEPDEILEEIGVSEEILDSGVNDSEVDQFISCVSNINQKSLESTMDDGLIEVNKKAIVNTYTKKSENVPPHAKDPVRSELETGEVLPTDDTNAMAELNIRPSSRIKILDNVNVTSDSDFVIDDSNSSESKTYHFKLKRTLSGRLRIAPIDHQTDIEKSLSPFSIASISDGDDSCISNDSSKINIPSKGSTKITVEKSEKVIEMTFGTDEESSGYSDDKHATKKRLINYDPSTSSHLPKTKKLTIIRQKPKILKRRRDRITRSSPEPSEQSLKEHQPPRNLKRKASQDGERETRLLSVAGPSNELPQQKPAKTIKLSTSKVIPLTIKEASQNQILLVPAQMASLVRNSGKSIVSNAKKEDVTAGPSSVPETSNGELLKTVRKVGDTKEPASVIINYRRPTTNLLTTATTATTSVVQNTTINPSNETPVVVRNSTTAASLVQNTTSTTNTGTAAPTLLNMLIQQPSNTTRTPVAAVREVTTRLRAQNFNTSVTPDEMFQNTVTLTNTNPIASTATTNTPATNIKTVVTQTPNIVRATVQQAPQIVRSVAGAANVVSSGGTPQLLSFQHVINSPQLLKTISNDGVKPLQLLYKMSDGKTFHITPVPLQSSVKMAAVKQNQQGEFVKVEVLTPTKTSANNNIGTPTTKSVLEETYAKFIHIGRNINSIVTQSNEVTSTTSSSSSLPKFQQAFGKTTSFATVNNSCATTADQQVLVVSKMATSTTASTTATTSAPLTVVSVPMGTTIMTTTVTSTIQRALASTGANVRLLKSNSQMPQAQSTSTQLTQAQSQTRSEKTDCDVDNSASNDSLSSGSITIQPGQQAVQSTVLTPMRLTLPIVQRATNASGNLLPTTRVMTPVLLGQRVLLTQGTVGGTIRLPQTARVLASNVTTNTLEPSVSSSTLEQLREFDKVFEKVKERSTVQPSPNSTVAPTTTTVTTRDTSTAVTSFINKLENSNASISVQVSEDNCTENRSSTPVTTFQTTHVDTNNIVVNQNQRQQRVGVAYVTSGSLGQTIISSPVVVMQQQPTSVASPALSVTSQSSASPSQTVNNNPTSSKTTPTQINKTLNTTATKSIKNKPIKPNTASPMKPSPVPKPQQKPQEDEGTTQRIYSILAEYAEQLRNSPDLNNKPAPRRRSNPPANPTQNSKRKKSSSGKKVGSLNPTAIELSPGADDHRTMGSEDSSCGILQMGTLQDSPSQTVLMDDAQSTEGSMDIPSVRGMHGDSNDCIERPSSSQSVTVPTSTPRQQLILTETNTGNTAPRNVIITDSVVSEALAQVGKITNTATVLLPSNYILPVSMVKGPHQITIVSGGSKILAVKPLKLPATLANNSTNSQQLTTTQVLIPTVSTQNANTPKISTQIINRTAAPASDQTKTQTLAENNVEGMSYSSTPMLAVQNKPANMSSASQVDDSATISGSNGPLLSQLCELPETTPSTLVVLNDSGKSDRDSIDNSKVNFKKNWITNNLNQDNIENQPGSSPVFRHSPGMQFSADANVVADKKRFTTVQQSPTSKFNNIQAQRKQVALERELRLQKSLSEECEDLGVDEPSASDLFPEAEILFDNTNQSPPFGNVLQDASCSNNEDNVFSTNDEENGKDNSETSEKTSKISITDHMDYLLIHKNQKHTIKNGTKFTTQNSNSSQSSYEDNNTLITNTPLISDVTIPSPLPQSTSYCLPSPYRAESPLTQATHSHLYSYTKQTKPKSNKKGRTYSLFESDCEISSSSDVETSRTSVSTSDAKEHDLNNDSLSDSTSDIQSDNNTRKYGRKRPYKLYVYDENGVDASSFKNATADDHISSDNNDESVSMSVDIEGVEIDTSEDTSRSADSADLASIGGGVRRLSQRGHVRKGCPCCTGSSPPQKRKFNKKTISTQNKKISGKKIS